MVNHKALGCTMLLQGFPDDAVGVHNALAKAVIAVQIVSLIFFVKLAESLVGVAGNDQCIIG